MLARRTCQRVVDKPSLACTALLATVYRSFFNNFLLYIYTHSQGNDARPFSNRKRLIETPYIYVSSPLHSFARIFLHLPKHDSSKSLLLLPITCIIIYLQIVNSSISSNYIFRFIRHIFNYWNRDSTCLFHVKNSLFHSLDNGGETRENPREKRKGKGRRQDKAR